MYNVLLVEDIDECQIVVKRALANASIQLTIAATLKGALDLVNSAQEFHLVILDIGLPDGEGLSVLEKIRISRPDTAVFLLTSHNDLDVKVTAFNLGADDYLTKPISAIELRARVEMRLKKSQAIRMPSTTLKKAGLTLDLTTMRATSDEETGAQPMALTAKEFKILAVLMQNETQVFSRQSLVKEVWGESVHIFERTVDSHIFGLRKKLKRYADVVECIPQVGYRFNSSAVKSQALKSSPGLADAKIAS